MELGDEIRDLINKHSRENASNTPDFILADYLMDCLRAFELATLQRQSWFRKVDAAVKSADNQNERR